MEALGLLRCGERDPSRGGRDEVDEDGEGEAIAALPFLWHISCLDGYNLKFKCRWQEVRNTGHIEYNDSMHIFKKSKAA